MHWCDSDKAYRAAVSAEWSIAKPLIFRLKAPCLAFLSTVFSGKEHIYMNSKLGGFIEERSIAHEQNALKCWAGLPTREYVVRF